MPLSNFLKGFMPGEILKQAPGHFLLEFIQKVLTQAGEEGVKAAALTLTKRLKGVGNELVTVLFSTFPKKHRAEAKKFNKFLAQYADEKGLFAENGLMVNLGIVLLSLFELKSGQQILADGNGKERLETVLTEPKKTEAIADMTDFLVYMAGGSYNHFKMVASQLDESIWRALGDEFSRAWKKLVEDGGVFHQWTRTLQRHAIPRIRENRERRAAREAGRREYSPIVTFFRRYVFFLPI